MIIIKTNLKTNNQKKKESKENQKLIYQIITLAVIQIVIDHMILLFH